VFCIAYRVRSLLSEAHNAMRPLVFFTVVLLGLTLALALEQPEKCPKVLDGLTKGRYDLSSQFSDDTINANWVFDQDVLRYEWAVISQSKASSEIKDVEGGCRFHSGFLGLPDVVDWTDVKKQNFGFATKLSLKTRETYYVILRTTLKSGVQVYSSSNGIVVLPEILKEKERSVSSDNLQVKEAVAHQGRLLTTRNNVEFAVGECPLDQANTCRAAKDGVQERLTQLYGPPVYSRESRIAPVVPVVVADDFANDNSSNDDDDSGGMPGGGIAGIITGTFFMLMLLLCLLCLVGCLFIRRGDSSDRFNERVITKSTEDVDADLGRREERVLADEGVRVEFPDLDASSRLSMA